MSIRAYPFGSTADGQTVTAYEITAENGMRAEILDLGCIINRLFVPDRAGNVSDIVLGCDTAEDTQKSPYFGAVIGRYGNRIAKGQFTLDDQSYQLHCNDGINHLHGGDCGFNQKKWKVDDYDPAGSSLSFSYISVDGEENYPGTVDMQVTYGLGDSALTILYHATTDAPTILNLTNHSYFNLAGHDSGAIGEQSIQLFAANVALVDDTMIPTGEALPVAETAFDFTSSRTIADAMKAGENDPRINTPSCRGGFDHNFFLDKSVGLGLVGEAFDPASGRVMTVISDQPCVQFYTANFLGDANVKGKDGAVYANHSAYCLETQHAPDSPHHPEWPSTVLRPGAEYDSVTIYRFSTRDN